jgi:hypothetical protein
MIQISRHAQSTFWADAFKGALVTAVPCVAFDWFFLSPDGAGLLAVLFLIIGIVFVPLGIFLGVAVVLFLFRRPGWLAGPLFILLLNGAFLDIMR